MRKWVETNVESANFTTSEDGKVFGIKCTECDGIMRNVNVQAAVTKKVHNRFVVRCKQWKDCNDCLAMY